MKSRNNIGLFLKTFLKTCVNDHPTHHPTIRCIEKGQIASTDDRVVLYFLLDHYRITVEGRMV